MTALQDRLKQTRPFSDLAEEAVVSLGLTSALLRHAFSDTLKPHGISPAQYNILRILRGAGERGLGRNAIRERLVDRMPDVTRLIDRLEGAGLVRRQRVGDRRHVPIALSPQGRALVNSLDDPLRALRTQHLAHLTPGQLHTLIEVLELIRAPLEEGGGGRPAATEAD